MEGNWMSGVEAGTRIADRYVVEERIGEGGMGIVVRARDERLGRTVAIKLLPARALGNEMARARLVREARAAAALEHPSIAHAYDAGETEDGGAFLVMELVRGRTLRERLEAGDMPLAKRLRAIVEVARALAHAHAHGLVHRDVKPDNVMIHTDGRAVVLDFGLAKAVVAALGQTMPADNQPAASLTSDGLIVGTPAYLAPEQATGSEVDARVDQFALGVTAYEALCGRLPWHGKSTVELLASLMRDAPPAASGIAPELPPEIDQVLARALAKDPAARYPSMTDLADALERVLRIVEAPPRSRRPPPPAPRRPRARRAIAAIALLACAAAVAGGLWLRRSKNAAPAAACRVVRGACVPLESAECRIVGEPGDATNPDTIWVGLMVPSSGPKAAVGAQALRSADLARRDFAKVSRGIPWQTPGRAPRPLAILACDDAADPRRVAAHLAELEVPAVIGFGSSDEAMDLARAVFVPHRTLTLVSMNPATFITAVPQPRDEPRLVWRTSPGAGSITGPVASVLSDLLEPRVRAAGAMPAAAPIRVALLRPDTASGLSAADAMYDRLRFNGRSAADNGPLFRAFVHADLWAPRAPGADDSVVRALVDFAPHVVLFVGGDEIVEPLLEPIARRWPAARQEPHWLAFGPLTGHHRIFSFIGSDAERRHRFFGVGALANTTANAKFMLHYNETFADKVTLEETPAGQYDAMYLVGYAAFASGDGPVTGAALARALPRLVGPSGRAIDVGSAHVFEALGALRDGESIDLHGANSRLAFDLASGEPKVDFAVQCVGVDENGVANDGVESGVVYDAKAGALTGTLRCP